MILGMSTATFTFLHVLISLVGIASGFVVVLGLISGKHLPRWTDVFLVSTILTSLTGFLFPFKGITPGIVLGILSLVVLAFAALARYVGNFSGAWRGTYVVSAHLALYFNFFVFIVQAFQKIPALKALAPTQSELPFKLTQILVLAGFVVLSVLAFKRFHGTQQPAFDRWHDRSSNAD
jgi:hypothetical protein